MKSLVRIGVLLIVSVFFASSAFAFGLSSLTGGSKSSTPSGGASIGDLVALFDGATNDLCDAGLFAVKSCCSLELIIAKDQDKDKIKAQLEKCNSCSSLEDKQKVMHDADPTISENFGKSVENKEFEKATLTTEQLKEVPTIGRNSLLIALKDKRAIDQLMRVKDTAMGVVNSVKSNPLNAVKEAKNISKLTSAISVIPAMIDSAGKQLSLASTLGSAMKQLTVGNKVENFEEPKTADSPFVETASSK